MSDEKKKMEKVVIIDPRPLQHNLAWIETGLWELPDPAGHGEKVPTLTIRLPYETMEEIQQLRSVLALNREEAEARIKEQTQMKSMMDAAGIDSELMGLGFPEEGLADHDCEGCGAYDECDLPIKKPLKS